MGELKMRWVRGSGLLLLAQVAADVIGEGVQAGVESGAGQEETGAVLRE